MNFIDANSKKIFFGSALLMLMYMLFSSGQYGISWDEKLQNDYGKSILKFYQSGFTDTSYINEQKLIHLYGGLVEVICAVSEKVFGGDEYNVRHFIIAVFGFLAMLFTGLLAKEINDWKTGLLALWFIFLTPVFFGHSMYNSKDIPFAFAYIAAVFFMVRFFKEFPNPGWSTTFFLVAAIAVSINIRIGGVLLIAYLWLFAFIKSVFHYSIKQSWSQAEIISFKNLYKKIVIVSVLGYLFGLIFWPYGLTNPLTHPFLALQQMSSYDAFDSYNLFEGHWIHRNEIPWYYIPKWMWITTPLFISGIILLSPFFLFKVNTIMTSSFSRFFLLILFTSAFPIGYIIFKNSNVYDGWRHALFVYPSLVVCCASLWQKFLSYLKNSSLYIYNGTVLFLLFFLLEPLIFMLRNRPLDSFYFSPLIGGVEGAFKQYEIDYYGTSIRQAVEWIANNSDTNAVHRVRCYYGEQESSQHFVNKFKHLKFVFASENSSDWDYSIVQPTQAKFDSMLLVKWPPANTVHEFKIDGAGIIAITKNALVNASQLAVDQIKNSVYNSNDVNYLINSSFTLFNARDYLGCIAANEKALMIDPVNSTAYNNICAAMSNLGLYEDAIDACTQALKLKPDFNLASSNLVDVKNKSMNKIPNATLANQYINLSVVYYNLKQYDKCIFYCKKSLVLKPDNGVAYNNICSCYNALGKFSEAEAACEKAVAIHPDLELFRNNLMVARTNLGKK